MTLRSRRVSRRNEGYEEHEDLFLKNILRAPSCSSRRRERPEYAHSFQGHQVRGYVVNVLVAIRAPEIPMRLQRIVDVDLRRVALGPKRPPCPVSRRQRHGEVVDAIELPLDLLT